MKERVLQWPWFYPKALKFSIYTLTYNAFKSDSPCADCAFEPIIWIVDHFAKALGRILVILVVFLITTVVVIFYVYVLPIVLEYEPVFMVSHLICGHWLLINISFHYYKAVATSPGHPSTGRKAIGLKKTDICTKCVQPKPSRTHHCSVCNRCILKMDHHCPWINNCVGHFNHRYFFMFCVYMFFGTVYVSLTTFAKFWENVTDNSENIVPDFVSSNKKIAKNGYPNIFFSKKRLKETAEGHNVFMFEFMLCSCVSLAVGGLALWHVYMISVGETSIERYINKKQRAKMKKEGLKFVNRYDFGIINNWKMFFGLVQRRGICSIIFPSSHQPFGDGQTWLQIPNRTKEACFMA